MHFTTSLVVLTTAAMAAAVPQINPNVGPLPPAPGPGWEPNPPANLVQTHPDPDHPDQVVPLECIIYGPGYDFRQKEAPDGWVVERGSLCPTPKFKDCPDGKATEMVITLRKDKNGFKRVIVKGCDQLGSLLDPMAPSAASTSV